MGWVAGWLAGLAENIANSAQLELELGLSLAIIKNKERLSLRLKSDISLFKFVTTVSQYRKMTKKMTQRITIQHYHYHVQEFEDSPVKNISLLLQF